jgi:hypothetical protein
MKKLLSFMLIATFLVSCNLEFKSLESAIEDFKNHGDYTNIEVTDIENFSTLAGAVEGTKVVMSTLDFEEGTVNYQDNIYRLNPETGEEEYLDPALVTTEDISIQKVLNDEEIQGEILEVNNDDAGLFIKYKKDVAKVVAFYIMEYNSPEAAELFVEQSLSTGLYIENSILQLGKYVFLGRIPGYEFQNEKQQISPNILALLAPFSPTPFIVGEDEKVVFIQGEEVITREDAEVVELEEETFQVVSTYDNPLRPIQREGRIVPENYPIPQTMDEVLAILAQGELAPLPDTEVELSEIADFLTTTGADAAQRVSFNIDDRRLAVYMAKYGYVQDGLRMYLETVESRAYDNNDLQINGTLIIWFTLPFPEYNNDVYEGFKRNDTVGKFWERL